MTKFDKLKKFLSENSNKIGPLINTKNFEEIYYILYDNEDDNWEETDGVNSLCGQFTELMYEIGINPLDHMDCVPPLYLAGVWSIETLSLPKHIRQIEYKAFMNSGLQKIDIPQDCELKTIDEGAFQDCDELTEIELSDKLKRIGYGCFWGCRNLEKIFIPESVESIGDDAFDGCPADIKIVNEGEDNIHQAFHVKPGDYEIDLRRYGLDELKVDWFHGWPRSHYRNNIWS